MTNYKPKQGCLLKILNIGTFGLAGLVVENMVSSGNDLNVAFPMPKRPGTPGYDPEDNQKRLERSKMSAERLSEYRKTGTLGLGYRSMPKRPEPKYKEE